jgi:hypothetical protein
MEALRDLIQTLLVIELLEPSQPLWLFFAWVTDVDILDNSARQFSTICPDWPEAPIKLSAVLEALLSRGGRINVILRNAPHNQFFEARLLQLQQDYPGQLRWCKRSTFHEKGMLGNGYVLDGSMNLTLRGLTTSDERVILRTSSALIAQRRIELQTKWDSLLQ